MSIILGILDIQGSVEEHFAILQKIGVSARLIKSAHDLNDVNGLIIPGGESTTIGKLLKSTGLNEAIRRRAIKPKTSGLQPLTLWGTCAGAILMAKKIRPPAPVGLTLNLMDIAIERNAYGSQQDSFQTELSVPELGGEKFPAVFIRAPKIHSSGRAVQILARHGNLPVMLQQENLFATMFHPELTDDQRIHKYFYTFTQHYARQKSEN